MLKRITAAVLSMVMCGTAVLSGCGEKSAAPQNNVQDVGIKSADNDYRLRTSNSLGNFIADTVRNDESSIQNLGNICSDVGFEVTALEFERESGDILLVSDQPEACRAVVTFTDDDSGEVALSVELSVEAGKMVSTAGKADVSVLSEFFIVSAQLFDKVNRPVGNSYKSNRYTRQVQEILAADISDFEAERVVNFDDDETTNFLVLGDDVVKAESAENVNTLVSADYEHDTYTFGNADDSIRGLSKGDDLYIQPDAENIIAIRVDSVTADGENVTVTGENNVDEILAFAKFESISDLSDSSVNIPDEAEDASSRENSGARRYAEPPSVGGDISPEEDGKMNVEYNGDKLKFTVKEDNFELGILLGLPVHFNFYKKFLYASAEIVLSPDITVSLKAETSFKPDLYALSKEFSTGKMRIPTNIPGIIIEAEPKFKIGISGSVEAKFSYAPKVGIRVESEGFLGIGDYNVEKLSKFDKKQCEASLDIKGEVFVGFGLDAGLALGSGNVVHAGFSASAGVTVSVEEKNDILNGNEINPDDISKSGNVLKKDSVEKELHGCNKCFEGKLEFEVKCDIDLKFLRFKAKMNVLDVKVPMPDFNFHVSKRGKLTEISDETEENGSDYDFGFGECGNKFFRTAFKVVNEESGKSISGATINVEGVNSHKDDEGNSYLFCKNGYYSYTVEFNGEEMKGTFKVDNAAQDIRIELESSTDDEGNVSYSKKGQSENEGAKFTTATKPTHKRETVTTYTFSGPQDQVFSKVGSLGDNIFYMFYPSGYLYIFGYGEMSKGNLDINKENVKTVVIENDKSEDGEEEKGGVITNIYDKLFRGCTNLTEITMPNSIEKIGNNAFEGCSSLKQIIYDPDDPLPEGKLVMPSAINELGESAFRNCSSFTDIVIPNTITEIKGCTFEGCSGITEIVVPSNVETIYGDAFKKCDSLKNIVIEEGVKTMNDCVFSYCPSIESLTLPYATQNIENADDHTSSYYCVTDLFTYAIDDEAYYRTRCIHEIVHWSVPKSLKTIIITGGTVVPLGAFKGLSSVETIVLPESINAIGDRAFQDCSSLKEIKLPDKLEFISAYAFANCASLGNVNIPSEVTTVGYHAFENCTSMTEIKLGKNVKTIGGGAFSGCTSLRNAVIEGGENEIGKQLFQDCTALESITLPYAGFNYEGAQQSGSNAELAKLFSAKSNELMYKAEDRNEYIPKTLKSITILGGTRIPNQAFSGFSQVESIVIPESITTIGNSAFRNAASIKQQPMNDIITAIGENAFENCAGMTEIAIGKSIETIGASAFKGCSGVTELYVPANVTYIGTEAFAGCKSLRTVVIEGDSIKLGNKLFNNCTLLESVTLPFAGQSLEAVNGDNSVSLVNMFNCEESGETYHTINASGGNCFIPSSLKNITVTGGEKIPKHAFYGFTGVESIIIPDSVTYIGNYAFGKCGALTENVMNNNITALGEGAFADCTGIKNIVFGESLAALGSQAFKGCSGVGELVIPETVTSVGNRAFSECSALKYAEIQGANTNLEDNIFNKCISLETLILPFAGKKLEDVNKNNSSSSIADFFYDGCGEYTYLAKNNSGKERYIPKSLKNIIINGGERIPNGAFKGLSSVESIVIPDSIVSLGSSSFAGCEGLTENVMNDNIETIGDSAFENCTGITKVNIGEAVKLIGDKAFAGCTGVTEVTVPANVQKLGKNVFSGCIGLENAVISDGVQEIGDYAFDMCTSLSSLTLPFAGNKLTDVNKGGSSDWLADFFLNDGGELTYAAVNSNGTTRYIPNSLTSVTITGGERIPNNAFLELSGVKRITLPKLVENIGVNAFSGCEAVTDVFYPDTAEKWETVVVGKGNESIEGKVRFLDSEGNYTVPEAVTTTTTAAEPVEETTTTTTTAAESVEETTTTTTAAEPVEETTMTTTTATEPFEETTTTTTTATEPVEEATTTTTATEPVEEAATTTTTATEPVVETTTTTTTAAEPVEEATTTTTAVEPVEVTTTTTTKADSERKLGDISGDGKVNAIDASMVLTYYAMMSTKNEAVLTDEEKTAGDVDGNGVINAVDASFMLSYYAYSQVTSGDIMTMKEFMSS